MWALTEKIQKWWKPKRAITSPLPGMKKVPANGLSGLLPMKMRVWKSNPESYKIEKYIVDGGLVLKLKLANGGGAAVSVVPATVEEVKSIKGYK
jgi:hypothetical protein